jgi:hypothetical protein
LFVPSVLGPIGYFSDIGESSGRPCFIFGF